MNKIYSAVDASKIIGIPLPKEKIAAIGKECLLKGKSLQEWKPKRIIKEAPPGEELIICGQHGFRDGRLSDGVEAL